MIAQMTSGIDVTSLTSCKILAPYCANFGDYIRSGASDRRHFRSSTSLHLVTFWAVCYEVMLP